MKKIMTIVGTRPELIKLSRVIPELDKYVVHVLVHTGQNYDYELNEVFFKDLDVRKPDYFLNAASDTSIQTIANVIAKSDEVMERELPDAVLVYGDTNSCLSVISAKRRKIPIFHMEAGNRCHDQRVPEEINRKIVDHISDINMTLTEHARRYLISEGIRPETVFKVGSSMREVLDHYWENIESSNILEKMNLKKNEYFIVSAHREENIDYDNNFYDLVLSLNAIAGKYGKRIIVSTHPRTKNKIEDCTDLATSDLVEFVKPFGFFDYISMQVNSYCVISDSGTITEEASLLQYPAVTIRHAHERPEGMDEGTLIMCGLTPSSILDAIHVVTSQQNERSVEVVRDYNVINVSSKIVRIILSYIDYVNRTVWSKC